LPLAVLAQVVPFGAWATALPFLLLTCPPELFCVVLTPFEFVCEVAPFPVLGLYAPADWPLPQISRPDGVLVQFAAQAAFDKTSNEAVQNAIIFIVPSPLVSFYRG
jgi:hypothetical protein